MSDYQKAFNDFPNFESPKTDDFENEVYDWFNQNELAIYGALAMQLRSQSDDNTR